VESSAMCLMAWAPEPRWHRVFVEVSGSCFSALAISEARLLVSPALTDSRPLRCSHRSRRLRKRSRPCRASSATQALPC
jgi:hypothetical protein